MSQRRTCRCVSAPSEWLMHPDVSWESKRNDGKCYMLYGLHEKETKDFCGVYNYIEMNRSHIGSREWEGRFQASASRREKCFHSTFNIPFRVLNKCGEVGRPIGIRPEWTPVQWHSSMHVHEWRPGQSGWISGAFLHSAKVSVLFMGCALTRTAPVLTNHFWLRQISVRQPLNSAYSSFHRKYPSPPSRPPSRLVCLSVRPERGAKRNFRRRFKWLIIDNWWTERRKAVLWVIRRQFNGYKWLGAGRRAAGNRTICLKAAWGGQNWKQRLLVFEPPLLFSLHLHLKVKLSHRQIYISFKQRSRPPPPIPAPQPSTFRLLWMRIDEAGRGTVCFTFMKWLTARESCQKLLQYHATASRRLQRWSLVV